LYGSGDESVSIVYEDRANTYRTNKPFEGVIPNMERRLLETDSESQRDHLSRYQNTAPCETCQGQRLKPEALAVKLDGKTISDVTEFSIGEAQAWFYALCHPEAEPKDPGAAVNPGILRGAQDDRKAGAKPKLTQQQLAIAGKILKEINERLTFLINVGLDYLTLARASGTLSGGESQRIRLASQIGSGLTGVLYVLDEPSIGLHQRDNNRLLETLRHLRDLGNTVLVVEHDEDAIRAADYLIDMGPGAGTHGGDIVASGRPEQVMENPASLTGQYLAGQRSIPIPARRRAGKNQYIEIKGCTGNNLKNIDARIPLGALTCITGVSGSGKSSLTIDTLYRAASQKLMDTRDHPLPFKSLKGLEAIDKIIDIDQSPIGRTPRSNAATYTGAFTPIRDWFAGLPESKARGYEPGRFSFNVKGGRCEACQGDGVVKIEMHFLPDVYVTCDVCKGHRYNRETLEVLYKGKSIADVLDMTVEEGLDFFKAVPRVRNVLELLHRVGLDYIHIGQQATTLSGG
ncbi:MAG TPA: excinuclease ABC subunit UvrA, partial [Alphaproteobacteria bacterium]